MQQRVNFENFASIIRRKNEISKSWKISLIFGKGLLNIEQYKYGSICSLNGSSVMYFIHRVLKSGVNIYVQFFDSIHPSIRYLGNRDEINLTIT